MSLSSIAERLARYSPTGHPIARRARAGEVFPREIAAGTPAPDALAAAGASDRVVAFVRAATPSDLPAVLDSLASALGRADDRARGLRDAWLYPFSLAIAAGMLAGVVLTFIRPRLQAGVDAAHGPAVSPSLPLLPVVLAILTAVALLLWLAAALRSDSARAPFAEAKRRAQRAVVLAAADAASSGGVPLPASLRAAAVLVPAGEVSSASIEVAGALERGEPEALASAAVLFGAIGGAVFATAARAGAGTAVLGALARIAEDDAAAMAPFDVMQAELYSLLLAGLAVAAGGAAVISCYSGAFRLP